MCVHFESHGTSRSVGTLMTSRSTQTIANLITGVGKVRHSFCRFVTFKARTERFTDLGKLKLQMVIWFQAQANFYYCPSCLMK